MTRLEYLTERCLRFGTTDNFCWEWPFSTDGFGYGYVNLNNKTVRAHRMAYIVVKGDVDLQVCHSCDFPSCFNPKHLFAGTMDDNNKDKARKGRSNNGNAAKTHCWRGHRFEGHNLIIDKKGDRHCRACGAIRQREYHQRKRSNHAERQDV